MVFTPLQVKAPSKWYFDFVFSKNIIGDKSFFTSFKDFNGGDVTFSDGVLPKWEVGVVYLFLDVLN